MDYAVFKTGGKQYRVKPGETLDVELLPLAINSVPSSVTFWQCQMAAKLHLARPTCPERECWLRYSPTTRTRKS